MYILYNILYCGTLILTFDTRFIFNFCFIDIIVYYFILMKIINCVYYKLIVTYHYVYKSLRKHL